MFIYSGINLGAALAPLVAGSLHRREGYEAGFLSAAFGMAVCLVTYQGLQWVITDSLRRKGTHRGGLGTRGFRGGADDDVFDDFEADGAVRSRRGNRGVGGSNPTGRDARDHTYAGDESTRREYTRGDEFHVHRGLRQAQNSALGDGRGVRVERGVLVRV